MSAPPSTGLRASLSTARIALKKAGMRHNNTVIAYLNSCAHFQETQCYTDFIVACYERWIWEAKGSTAIELLGHIENLRKVKGWGDAEVPSAHLHSQAGQYYLQDYYYKKAIYHFEKAISLDPDNEEHKNHLAQAIVKVKARKRKIQIISASAVILVVIGISFQQ